MEQRRDRRYEVSVTAEIFLQDRVVEATTRNLSKSGICFECAPVLSEGDTVAATLYLTVDGIEDASTAPLKVTTHVQWIGDIKDGLLLVGAEFVNLDNSARKTLNGYLEALGGS